MGSLLIVSQVATVLLIKQVGNIPLVHLILYRSRTAVSYAHILWEDSNR
jgi:hypothetical protein